MAAPAVNLTGAVDRYYALKQRKRLARTSQRSVRQSPVCFAWSVGEVGIEEHDWRSGWREWGGLLILVLLRGRRLRRPGRFPVYFGQVGGEIFFDDAHVGAASEVGELVSIVFVVVEFFSAIGVTNVTVAPVADGVIEVAVGRECNAVPVRLWILKKRDDALAFEVSGRLKPCQFAGVWGKCS